jgi:hypothetical protein
MLVSGGTFCFITQELEPPIMVSFIIDIFDDVYSCSDNTAPNFRVVIKNELGLGWRSG